MESVHAAISAHESIHSGVDAQSDTMAGVDEGLEIIEIPGPLYKLVLAVHPGGKLYCLRRHLGSVEYSAFSRSDVDDDVSESGLLYFLQIVGDAVLVIGIILEIGGCVYPYISRLALE